MKLVRFGDKGSEKPGIEIDNVRKDCSSLFEDWNHAFFFNDGIKKLQELTKENDLPEVPEHSRWASPIARPNMIMCVGLNYADHAKESGMDLPNEPLIFGKANNTMIGPFDDVRIMKKATKVDYEVELGVVLGQNAFELSSEEEAENAIGGYTVVNDLSERAFQLECGGQWIKGKSCLDFCPTGPYLITKDELSDISDLKMKMTVNGDLRQNGSTNTMVFKPAYIIYYLSQFMKLEAGDLISTGTPPGVGMGMNPPQYLNKGDHTITEIEGLGVQRTNYV